MIDKKNKNPAHDSELGFKSDCNDVNNISLPAQRQRLLACLQEKSITTIEARHDLNILMPAARIHELRHKYKHNIVTTWTNDMDAEGRKHRVGRYFLLNDVVRGEQL